MTCNIYLREDQNVHFPIHVYIHLVIGSPLRLIYVGQVQIQYALNYLTIKQKLIYNWNYE